MSGSDWAVLGLAYHVASRLAYVLFVGIALRREERAGYSTKRAGFAGGFRRFRRIAAALMTNDAASFVVLCLLTRGALGLRAGRGPLVVSGAALVLAGGAIKLWAAATLEPGAYYWRNFFTPGEPVVPKATGPYRWLKHPMYTAGYLPAYGLALVTGSAVALGAALFDQAAILAFSRLVEEPHLARRRVPPGRPRPAVLDSARSGGQNEGSPIRSPDP